MGDRSRAAMFWSPDTCCGRASSRHSTKPNWSVLPMRARAHSASSWPVSSRCCSQPMINFRSVPGPLQTCLKLSLVKFYLVCAVLAQFHSWLIAAAVQADYNQLKLQWQEAAHAKVGVLRVQHSPFVVSFLSCGFPDSSRRPCPIICSCPWKNIWRPLKSSSPTNVLACAKISGMGPQLP